jgi:membrane associated rhomboid family serine protease
VVALAARLAAAYVGGHRDPAVNQSSEPIFNIPPVVLALTASMIAIHVGRALLLGIDSPADDELLGWFAFVTDRYGASPFGVRAFPGGFGAEIWTLTTYALLHADFSHLAMNSLWFVAFGTPVARRFGALRFLLLFVVTAAAGAAAFLVIHGQNGAVLIGASAVASGMMGAAARFAFQPDGPITLWQRDDRRVYQVPALPLTAALRERRILVFLAVWFAVNLLFGLVPIPSLTEGQTIAWESHIGGFLAGLLLFRLFDPVPAAPHPAQSGEDMPQ